MFRSLLVALPIIALLSISSAWSKPMSLSELAKYGLENSPSMKTSLNHFRASQLTRENAFSSFLPSLDVSAVHGYQDNDQNTVNNPWASTLSLGLTETLYDNGSQTIGYRNAKLNERKAQIEWIRDKNSFCLKIANEFFQYSQAVELHKIQLYQHNILVRQFKSLESKYQRGEKTRTEYLRFKAQVQRSELSLTTSKNSIEKSLLEIRTLIGFSGDQLEIQPLVPDNLPLDLSPTHTISLDKHFELRIAENERAVNENLVRLERRKYYPQLFLTAGMSYSNSDYLAGGNTFNDYGQTSWNALLTLKYNLWDWGSLRRNVALAKIQSENSNNSIDERLLTLETTLSKLAIDLDRQKQNFKMNQELVTLESNNLKSIEQDYRSGRATFLDLVDAVDNLTSAKTSLLTNYFELSKSLAEYDYHQGNLYEKIFSR